MPADIKIRQFSLSLAEKAHSWRAQIALADKADWDRFAIGDPFDIQIGAVNYTLQVDNKQLQRPGLANNIPVITAVSPLSAFGAPLAARISRTWSTPVSARAAVEDVLQQSVQWNIVDWMIDANRLAFTDTTPLTIAQAIVEAAGGVLRSDPDGTVVADKRFPVSVPAWAGAVPDHVLSDLVDNVTLVEQHLAQERVNKIYTSSQSGDLGRMTMQIDARPDGLNQGSTSFAPGDPVGVLVFVPDGAVLDTLQASIGNATIEADQVFQETQDVAFSATDTSSLNYPAELINSITWLGNDLGALALDTDKQAVSIAAPGVGICRVVYQVRAKAFRVATPQTVSGLSDYPVQIHIEADQAGASSQRSIIGQRGDGDKQGPDITDPILTDINALLARATAELDTGEGLQNVTLQCIYRDNFARGQIVQIEDSEQPTNWRGMISGITHNYDGIKTLATLDILRK